MTEPPEDVIEVVRFLHGCNREEALTIIEREVQAVTTIDPMWRHPRGRPCQDCGRYFDEHPTRQCGGWS